MHACTPLQANILVNILSYKFVAMLAIIAKDSQDGK